MKKWLTSFAVKVARQIFILSSLNFLEDKKLLSKNVFNKMSSQKVENLFSIQFQNNFRKKLCCQVLESKKEKTSSMKNKLKKLEKRTTQVFG